MEANIYYPDELIFLKNNFFKMTNQLLLEEINSKRDNPVTLPGLLHQCRRLGLRRGIQIRWSKEDERYLIRNFRKIGNVELAERLNKRKKTFRIINGKRTYKMFTKKHVEKKMKLLKLQRTPEELAYIKKKNIETGRIPTLSSTDNYWTNGTRTAAPENDIRTWKINGRLKRVIKIDGQFVQYTRWFYHNFIGELLPGEKVYHLDMDTLNDEPENLYKRTGTGYAFLDYKCALPLIENRINEHKKTTPKTREEEKEWQKQLRHLMNVQKEINTQISQMTERGNSMYLKQKHYEKILFTDPFMEIVQ